MIGPRLVLLTLVLTLGCASATGRGTARVMADGEQEMSFGFELGLGAARLSPARPGGIPWMQLASSYRRGLDVAGFPVEGGARLWGIGAPGIFSVGGAIDLKIPLMRAEALDRGWDISLAPGIGYHQINQGGASLHLAIFELPLLFGWNSGGGSQLFFGLRIDDHVLMADSLHTQNLLYIGVQLGYSWRLSELYELRPEIISTYTPVSFNGTRDDPTRRGLSIFQFIIGNVFRF